MSENGLVEYKQVENLWIQESVLNKTDSGFERRLSDGTVETFNDIENNEEMPKEIEFDVTVDEFQKG